MMQAERQTGSFTSPSTGEVEIIVVPPYRIPEFEVGLREHLKAAIEKSHDRVTMDEVFQKAECGLFQLWVSLDAMEVVGAAVTQMIKWGTGRRSLELFLAGGKYNMHRNTVPTMAKLEEFAEAAGCASVMVTGRKGWERALPEGYRFSHSTFEKELRS